jgi:CheY-like chemotaxis protein
VLEPAGYAVLTARDATQGLELARVAAPDVMLVDLVMPEVDGFMLVEQLKQDATTCEIPIVVLTSKTLTPDDEEALRGRIAHLAQKAEFDRAGLLELIARFTPARTA